MQVGKTIGLFYCFFPIKVAPWPCQKDMFNFHLAGRAISFFKFRYSWPASALPRCSRWFYGVQDGAAVNSVVWEWDVWDVPRDVFQTFWQMVTFHLCQSAAAVENRLFFRAARCSVFPLWSVCITRAPGERLRDFHCWCRMCMKWFINAFAISLLFLC